MKNASIVFCFAGAVAVLPAAVFADAVGSSNAAVNAQGSAISSGGYGTYDSVTGLYELSTTNDLIDGATAIAEDHGTTATNTFNVGWTGGDANGLGNLTNGSFGADVQVSGRVGTASAGDTNSGAGYYATYSLGSNPLGYSVSDIEVYSGWSDNGRYQQAYTIDYSLVGSPTTFLPLTTISAYPTGAYDSGDTNRGAETILTPTAGNTLLTGVADVEIDFGTVVNSWTGYREFVVDGAATAAPEPASIALIALAAPALLVRRRRQANG